MLRDQENKRLITLDAVDCEVVRRINRFVVLVKLENVEEYAHITNTGRLEEFLVEGRRCKAIRIAGRKLNYRIVAVEHASGMYAVIDTRLQSKAFETAVSRGLLCFLHNCRIAGREPRLEGGRADYLLDCNGDKVVVELKSAVLEGPGGEAMYPDCPSDRGVRHINELAKLAEAGNRAAVVFVAGFPGARCFKPYKQGDPRIYTLLREAINRGLEVYSFSLGLDPLRNTIFLDRPCIPLCREWLEGDDEW